MAESAVRGGFSVSVLDGFCDQDTRAAASCRQIRFDAAGFDPAQLLTELARLEPGRPLGMVYGAGLEATPSLLRRLSQRCKLFGNASAVLELLADPAAYFNLLDSLQIPYPEVRYSPPERTTAKTWLVKKAGSSGGQGVTFWSAEQTATDPGCYYQRFIRGETMSVLFIADGESHQRIGYNRLKVSAARKSTPFLYSGAVGQMSLDPGLHQHLERFVAKLVERLHLRGVNSLDFILSKGKAYVLDLNPRPSATLELYDHQVEAGWMKLHIQACLGKLPGVLPPAAATGVYGHLIVYAPRALEIPAGMDWPAWTRDRPDSGTRIARGEPVCSLFARGRTAAEVETGLQQYRSRLPGMLSAPGAQRIADRHVT